MWDILFTKMVHVFNPNSVLTNLFCLLGQSEAYSMKIYTKVFIGVAVGLEYANIDYFENFMDMIKIMIFHVFS